MLTWKKMPELRIGKKLTVGKGATVVTENSDGTTSEISVSELELLNGITTTAAELNRSADISARIVTTTATALSLTVTEHAERIVLINTNSTVANTFTLPLATGTGAKMTLINNIAQTQGSVVIAANGTTNTVAGVAYVYGTTTADAEAFVTSATSDKITLNRTTTGGLGGDMVEAWDTATGVWTVQVRCIGSGTLATPFAAS